MAIKFYSPTRISLVKFTSLFDWPLLVSASLLLFLGLTVLFSTNPEAAKSQLLFAAIGMVAFLLVSSVDYHFWRYSAWHWYFLTMILLVLVLVLGRVARGSARWLTIGQRGIQPSELAKISLILILSRFFYPLSTRWLSLKKIILSIILAGPLVFLVFAQPDLGTTLIILGIWVFLAIYAGVKPSYLLMILLLGGLASYPAWRVLQPYQKERVAMFLNPYMDPLGAGYHILQSKIAIGSGGFWGRGFGRGTQSHLLFLPEYYTDFVFASFAEEWGFLGSLVMIGLFVVLMLRILQIAKRCEDNFGEMLCVGVFAMLMLQVLINMGMNLGLMPVTGITLPLVSYGGSSLITVMISLGLVQAVARKKRL
ncbi:MAG: rod shape-determining protein RodA [bacterium]|nr:rod shape-determining protein RodA [bacterium]